VTGLLGCSGLAFLLRSLVLKNEAVAEREAVERGSFRKCNVKINGL